MKSKQLFIAVIIVMASIAATGCKKDSSVTPTKNYQPIKLASADSTNLSGGGDGPIKH
ncbi:hypothetical protein [Mucilaginibacter sp.]|uniref:hypothetical protein n=1 Tax=Mucilaginibacter sp. TaxID=1882438 RepID=UPI00260EC1DD|nr:hypothetical protein [Mucilaginibacter sp.]MDB4920144.1 hypothetical protein [Mucilaginibacter sp.]